MFDEHNNEYIIRFKNNVQESHLLTELHSGQMVFVNVACSTSNSSSCNLLCIKIVSRFKNFKSQATHTQIFLNTNKSK